MKLGVSTTIATGEIYQENTLSLNDRFMLTHYTTLEFAKNHKLKYVELSILDPHSIKDLPFKEFQDMLSSYDFKYTYHAPIFELNLGATNPIWKKASLNMLKEHIEFCQKIGTENMVVHPYRPMGLDSFFFEDIVLSVMESAKKLEKITSPNILFENLPNPETLFSSPDIMLMLENTNFCFDTAHANCAGIPQKDFIEALGTKIKEVHIIDGENLMPDMHLPVGEGDIDFTETKKSLEKIKFRGPIILEAFSPHDAEKSIKNIKKIFN